MRIKKYMTAGILSLAIAVAGVVSLLPATTVGAIDVLSKSCDAASGTESGGVICGAKQTDTFENMMKNVINTILVVLGMIAVIMIIVGGIRYTTSNGDASGIQAAKNTILYAVIGLVVAILSYAIVNFVLDAFSGGSDGGGSSNESSSTADLGN